MIKVLLHSNCSFRSFSKIVSGLYQQGLYAGKYTPSYGTLINWSIRAGVAKLRGVKRCDGPCVDIIDHWVGKGNVKLFATLRMPLSKYQAAVRSKTAPALKHLELIHLEVMSNSSGAKVSTALINKYTEIGEPLAIISDSGSDLVKALKLINQDRLESKKIHHIEDISHRLAIILKKEYGKEEWFNNFFSTLGKACKKLHNHKYSYLKAPVRSDKARFMNVHRQTTWYFSRLDNIEHGNFKDDEKLIFDEVYKDLKTDHSKIEELHKLIEFSHKIMGILKVEGMNARSYDKCIELILKFQNENIKQSVIKWLDQHYQINQQIVLRGWDFSMPISSDPIESFFSKYKAIQGRTPEGDPTRVIAILALLVGEDSSSEIQNYLHSVSHKVAKSWVDENVPETIHSKKRKIYKKTQNTKVPKSGERFTQAERAYEKAYEGAIASLAA